MINKFIYFFMRNLLRYTNFFKNFCLPKKSQRGREMLPYSIYVLIERMNYKIKKKKKKKKKPYLTTRMQTFYDSLFICRY